MKSELNYNEAYRKLQELVEQLEDGHNPLDKLADNVKQANGFLAVCENTLTQIRSEVEAVADKVSKKSKG